MRIGTETRLLLAESISMQIRFPDEHSSAVSKILVVIVVVALFVLCGVVLAIGGLL